MGNTKKNLRITCLHKTQSAPQDCHPSSSILHHYNHHHHLWQLQSCGYFVHHQKGVTPSSQCLQTTIHFRQQHHGMQYPRKCRVQLWRFWSQYKWTVWVWDKIGRLIPERGIVFWKTFWIVSNYEQDLTMSGDMEITYLPMWMYTGSKGI